MNVVAATAFLGSNFLGAATTLFTVVFLVSTTSFFLKKSKSMVMRAGLVDTVTVEVSRRWH